MQHNVTIKRYTTFFCVVLHLFWYAGVRATGITLGCACSILGLENYFCNEKKSCHSFNLEKRKKQKLNKKLLVSVQFCDQYPYIENGHILIFPAATVEIYVSTTEKAASFFTGSFWNWLSIIILHKRPSWHCRCKTLSLWKITL